jgi:hypothetical protein
MNGDDVLAVEQNTDETKKENEIVVARFLFLGI